MYVLAGCHNYRCRRCHEGGAGTEKKLHLQEASTTRNLLKGPLNSSGFEGFRVITIDLQQQQPCPKMPVTKPYYTSKLWFVHFCVFDLTKDKAHMYMWDETVAKRGPNEISSCILRWLEHVREVEVEEITALQVFADNCASQNENIFNVQIFLQQIQNKLLCRVDMIFLISGHSFMPCDRDSELLRNCLGIMDASVVFLNTLKSSKGFAKKKKKKIQYQVHEMQRQHFYDVKALEKYVTNRSAGHLLKAKQFVIKTSDMEGFIIKNNYSVRYFLEAITYVSLQKGHQRAKGHGRPKKKLLLANVPLSYKYP